jgi:hypothetical protein
VTYFGNHKPPQPHVPSATSRALSNFDNVLKKQKRNFLLLKILPKVRSFLKEPQRWALIFHVSMDGNLLDTKLHTRFAIFLYTYRLETAMLTRRVHLDAADAERSVSYLHPSQKACAGFWETTSKAAITDTKSAH